MHQARIVPSRFRQPLARGAILALVMLLAACGFQMRGVTPLPFDSMYVGIPDNTRFGADLRRALHAASPNTRLVDTPGEAQAILQQIGNQRTLRDVALNAQGRVEEYELGLNFTFRLIDAKGNAIIPDTTLSTYRQMPYDDQVVQSKQTQIETLYESMQESLIARLLRRLTAPDVRETTDALRRGEVDPQAPVYDPGQKDPDEDIPDTWKSPSVNPGMSGY
ncbi:LPS-assembly lipoprotein LptE [Bordetella sp. 2513F-2]